MHTIILAEIFSEGSKMKTITNRTMRVTIKVCLAKKGDQTVSGIACFSGHHSPSIFVESPINTSAETLIRATTIAFHDMFNMSHDALKYAILLADPAQKITENANSDYLRHRLTNGRARQDAVGRIISPDDISRVHGAMLLYGILTATPRQNSKKEHIPSQVVSITHSDHVVPA